MVVSDPQDLKYVRPAMTQMLCKAYDSYSPDLVLFNGDNILGNHLLDARFGNRKVAFGADATFESMKEALSKLLTDVDSRNIPFAMVYGNHDDMNLLTKEEQMAIYHSYDNCLEMNISDKSVDCDTYVITLTDKNGKVIWAVYMLDSAWQDKDRERKCHCEIKKETVDWFIRTSNALKESNGGKPVPGIVLTHIPLPEIYNLLKECDENTPGAIKCDDGKYRILNDSVASGIMMEAPSVVTEENGLFDAMADNSGVKAIVFGHDHSNCFDGTYRNIDILQTGAASFRCYGNVNTKGIRLIDLQKDGNYSTRFIKYKEIMGDTVSSNIRYFNNADEHAVKKYSILGSAAIAASAITVFKIIKHIIKKSEG